MSDYPVKPIYLLWAIIGLCVLAGVACFVLDLAGHPDQVVAVMGFAGPVVTGLLAWKVDLNRRVLEAKSDIIESKVNGQREKLAVQGERIDLLEDTVRPPEPPRSPPA